MFLVQISDTHLLSPTDKSALALKRADNLERCVNTINQMSPRPAAIIHTGDMVNFAPPENEHPNGYELAFEILSKLKAPFYPTIGNRDARRDLIAQFLAPDQLSIDAPFCQYRVKLQKADLICVDTKSATHRIGASCKARRDQLDGLLQQDINKPVIVFMHHPPMRVKTLKNPLQFESIEQARALTGVLDRYDNIVRILCGHTHRSDFMKMGRHTASTHPSLATDVRLDQYPDRLTDEPVFQVHQLQSDLSVTSASQFAAPRKIPVA